MKETNMHMEDFSRYAYLGYENDFDNISNSQCKIPWYPWVGVNYVNSKNRIMIIGETHYSNEAEPEKIAQSLIDCANNRNFTKEVIMESGIRLDWRNKMLDGLYSALFGKNILLDSERIRFWQSISFYNFIQRPMEYNTKKKERPTEKDFYEGWRTFVNLVSILKPKQVIFIGVQAMYFMHDALNGIGVKHEITSIKKVDRAYSRCGWLEYDGCRVDLISIRHTSRFFSWVKWNEELNCYMPEIMINLKNFV